ncbi:MAG: hypothetical protein HKM93_05960 [Desulfobacteraceae bacterium]|nr:hypothetical protein [Desulfobacteraceae bacterium]
MRIMISDTIPIKDQKQNRNNVYQPVTGAVKKKRRKSKTDRQRDESDGVFVTLSSKKDRRDGADQQKKKAD